MLSARTLIQKTNKENSKILYSMKVLSLSFMCSICLFLSNTHAQKVGHINSVQLIDSLNEAKVASITLKQYDASLTKTGEEMLAKYQEKVRNYQQNISAGSFTAVQKSQAESDLQIEQQALSTYRQSAQSSLEKRRQELIQPILDKINKAIQDVGKEEGYAFVFDSAMGVLYFNKTDDIFPKVMKKLGY